MNSRRYIGVLVLALVAMLSLGLGLDKTFSEINQGLKQSTSRDAGNLFVVWSETGPKLTKEADHGRYFLSPDEIDQASEELDISLTLLEYKDSRTVVLLRLERWTSEGLVSATYEGHRLVAIPVRSSFLPTNQIEAAVWSGIRLFVVLFLTAGAGLLLLSFKRQP